MKDKCKERVSDNTGWGRMHQCTRNATLDGFCKQHHPDSVAERDRKAIKRYEAKREASPYHKIEILMAEIKQLKEIIEQYKKTECFIPSVTCSDNCSLVRTKSKEKESI